MTQNTDDEWFMHAFFLQLKVIREGETLATANYSQSILTAVLR